VKSLNATVVQMCLYFTLAVKITVVLGTRATTSSYDNTFTVLSKHTWTHHPTPQSYVAIYSICLHLRKLDSILGKV